MKTGDDLEVFEVDMCSREKLHEVCDLRQPVLFEIDTSPFVSYASFNTLLQTYHAFDVNIRNTKEPDFDSEVYIPIALDAAAKLFEGDKASTYISERNGEFINETGVLKHFQYNDAFLRPSMLSYASYDILTGSSGAETPLRYDINYRNFYIVSSGTVHVKLAPPKSSKYLLEYKDYDNFEFRSPISPWSPKSDHAADFSKVKCLEITMSVGQSLHIPAYWWYSFRFSNGSSLASLKYRTYMSTLAIVPHLAMYTLQRQNVKHNMVQRRASLIQEDVPIPQINVEPEPEDSGKPTSDDDKKETQKLISLI